MGGSSATVVRRMMESCTFAKLVENGWQTWPQFRQTVAHMHLLLQPSYTESFNVVTADGVAEGVPSVVSSAIDWAPTHWMADADDVPDIARVGISLLHDRQAGSDGLKSLTDYVTSGTHAWSTWINEVRQPTGKTI